VSHKAPWVNCYGCAAHVLNLLASDLRNTGVVAEVLEKNKRVTTFFKSHGMAKSVLNDMTKAKFGTSINPVMSCATRWHDYFMITS